MSSGVGSATGSVTGWSNLDRDTLAAIISFLDPPDVATLACTCRDAHIASRENAVWAPLLAHYYGLSVQVGSHNDVAEAAVSTP
jgi:hypothetical protein